jgi:hypothetical protein
MASGKSSDKTTDITSGETTVMTTSHLTNPAKDAGQVIGYSHSTSLSKDNNQVAGYSNDGIVAAAISTS